MRLQGYSAPGDFQLLDTRVNAADSFANVRDLQKLRSNHNALLGKRTKRTLFNWTPGTRTVFDSSQPFSVWNGIGGRSLGDAVIVMNRMILVSQHTKELRLKIRATKSIISGGTLAYNPILYPKISPLHGYRNIEHASTEIITVSAAFGAITTYLVDIGVPHYKNADSSLYRGHVAFMFSLYLQCRIDHTNTIYTGKAISAVDRNWIEPGFGFGSTALDNAITFGTDLTIPARFITRRSQSHGANGRYYIDVPWPTLPQPGVDTIDIRATQGIYVYSMSLYENEVTDFTADYGVID